MTLHQQSILAALLGIMLLARTVLASAERTVKSLMPTKYLLFQIFTYADQNFPPQDQTNATVNDIVKRIGIKGDKSNKLGFAVGPLTLSHSDAQIHQLIADSFRLAKEQNVAVAFHIDDNMFVEKRRDLLDDKSNIEWLDFKGTLCTGRRLDWGPQPTKISPQICFNSAAVKDAVRKRAHFIGSEIKTELDKLRVNGKDDLFAGVISGWETQIGRDFVTNRCNGYHALHNAGLDAENTPSQCEAALVKIVKEFMELSAKELCLTGIPKDKIYSHIAFTSQGFGGGGEGFSYLQLVGYAPPEVAFSKYYLPGFSTYPSENAVDQIRHEVTKRDRQAWASCEGTNVVPNGVPGEAGMETYLGKMYNHGAVMVNIYSWGIGGDANKKNLFRLATESSEALSAYQKFLTGKVLHESERSGSQFSVIRFQEKIHTIQKDLPSWVGKTGRPETIQPLMQQLDGLIKGQKFVEADKLADKILKLISSK
jgi:hypothetical protein